MKNKLFLYAIILIAGLSSCKKDEIQNTTGSLSKEDLNTEALILGFKDKLQNNNFKSGETMSLNDAVWNMEASLNYDYAQADAQHEKTLHYTDYFYLQLNSSQEAELDEINDVLNQMADQLSVRYHAIGEENKSFIVGDVGLVNVQNNIVQLSMGSVFGVNSANDPDPFESWEWWYALGEEGICNGPCVGQFIGRDATTELESKLNPVHTGTLPPGMHIYYSNIISVTVNVFADDLLNPNDPTPGDNIVDYRAWCTISDAAGNYPDCVSPVDWNFYLEQAQIFIDQNNPGGGRILSNFDVEHELMYLGTLEYKMNEHLYTIKYGVKHYTYSPIGVL